MLTTEEKLTDTESKKLVIVREFDAPIELVWKAWTDEEHHKKWWGPENYTSPYCKIDLRVGGKYLFCMSSPKGNEYWTTGEFLEISAPVKLVYTDSFSDKDGNVLTPPQNEFSPDLPLYVKVTVLLIEKNRKTIMTLIHEGIEEREMKQMAERIWNEAFDKMAASFK
jgi:uncharacterized protein YndB with AHSA1/START domain